MKKTMIIVIADTNDADFVTEIIEEGDRLEPDNLERFKKIAEIVKNNTVKSAFDGNNNWGWGEYTREGDEPAEMYKGKLSEEDIEFFQEYLPYGEFGIHTIWSIRILEIAEEEAIILHTWGQK